MKKTVFFILLFVINNLVGQMLTPSQKSNIYISVKHPVYFDVSPPLGKMIKEAKPVIIDLEERERREELIEKGFEKFIKSKMKGKVENNMDDLGQLQKSFQSRAPNNITLSTLANFDGVDNIDGVAPPDTQGDVSTDRYMQCVNNHTAIYDKSGNTIQSPFPTSDFWQGTPYDDRNDGDAVILWDEDAQKWFVTQFYVPSSGTQYILTAVSTTSDPTGSYYRYAFAYTYMPDYPKFAIWHDGYYMGANAFDSNGNFKGAYISAFDRSAMIAGNSNPTNVTILDGNQWSLFPADTDALPNSSIGGCFFMNDDLSSNSNNNEVYLYQYNVDWANQTGQLNNVQTFSVSSYDLFGGNTEVPQNGTSQKLDLLQYRIMYRPYYKHFSDHDALLMTRTVNDGGVAAVRWYEFRNSGSGWSVYQQGTYNPGDGLWRWMPSIAMNNNGDIALGYSVSGSSIYPSIKCVARYDGDALNVMTSDELNAYTGTDAQTNVSRWGDYSMISVDPSDNTSFWFTTEYTTGSWNWKTKIIHFSLPSQCVYPNNQATNFSVTAQTDTTIDISWTRGDGTNVIVLAKQDTAVDSNPSDGTNYTANANFGNGDEIGTGNFVVYNGTGTSVQITGLTNSTTYHFAVYEYNSTDYCYLTPALTGNGTTDGPPTVETLSMTSIGATDATGQGNVTSENGASVTERGLCWSTSPNPTTADSYVASGSGTGNYTGNLTGLSPSTTYYVRAYAINTYGTSYGDNINFKTDCVSPDNQATNFSATNIQDNQMDISWSRGDGDKVLVVAKRNNPVDTDPDSGTNYNANTNFGNGDEIGTGNFVVYNGAGNSVTITGLNAGTTYYFAIYEYFDNGYCYNKDELTGNATTTGTSSCNYCYAWGNNDYQTSTTRVIFNTIDNASGKDLDNNGNAYSDFTNISTNVYKGNNYNLIVNVDTDGNYEVKTKVWIDWNQDCDFDDAGEEYDLGTATNVSDGNTSESPLQITVPTNAFEGRTTMRVATKFNNYATSCETDFDGEIEDYTINVACNCYAWGNNDYQTSTTRVIFNTIDNASGKDLDDNGNAYSDFTNILTTLYTDNNYDLTVKVNTDGNYSVETVVWIDWNQDCDFDDAGEEYDLGTATNVSDGNTSESPLQITVPTNAFEGRTTMRVATKFNNYATSCETDFDGEVEDYTLNIHKCNGTTTTWNSTSWDNGIPDINTAVIIAGNYTVNASNPSFEACSLTINQGVDLTIDDNYYIKVKNDFENNGTIRVKNKAAFVQINNNGQTTGNGNFIVEKTTPDYMDYDYIYWSSPLDNEQIGSVLQESPQNLLYKYNTTNFLDLYDGNYPQTTGSSDTYDDNGDDWVHVSGNEIMQKGIGYIAMGKDSEIPYDFNNMEVNTGQSVVFNDGKFNNGTIQVAVVKDKYNEDGLTGADNYHSNSNLLGNPYPSAIDVVKLKLKNNNILSGTFYIWTHDTQVSANSGPNAYDYTADDYATMTVDANGNFSQTASSSGTNPSRYIASCQGFFADVNDNGDVVFDNSMRIIDNNDNFFRPSSSNTGINRFWLNLTNNNFGVFRQIYIGFYDNTHDTYVAGEDGARMENGNNDDFYSIIPGIRKRFAIQNLSAFNENKIIPLGIEITHNGTYQIDVDRKEGVFNTGQKIYLNDLETGIIHDFDQGAYIFTSNIVDNYNRFMVIFVNSTSGVETIADNILVYPNPSKNIFYFSIPEKNFEIEIYDISGKLLKVTNKNIVDLSNLSQGVYYAGIKMDNNYITKKLILKK